MSFTKPTRHLSNPSTLWSVEWAQLRYSVYHNKYVFHKQAIRWKIGIDFNKLKIIFSYVVWIPLPTWKTGHRDELIVTHFAKTLYAPLGLGYRTPTLLYFKIPSSFEDWCQGKKTSIFLPSAEAVWSTCGVWDGREEMVCLWSISSQVFRIFCMKLFRDSWVYLWQCIVQILARYVEL